MYYLKSEKSGQFVSGIVKLRDCNGYAVYFGAMGNQRWASEKGAQDALSRLLDCEKTVPPAVALELIVVDENAEQGAIQAQERRPARSLTEIEAEILAQKRTIGRSIVIIGHNLIEAKGRMEHGLWGTWLQERVNFSQSTAENYMRIAEQVSSDSALLDLPYTKILALLSVPAEAREEFAADNHVEDKSVSEIKQLIRERDEAIREAKAIRSTLSAVNAKNHFNEKSIAEAEAKLEEQKKRNSELVKSLSKALEEKQELMKREPDTVTVEKEVAPADYESNKRELEFYKRRAADAEARAKEAEEEGLQAQVERDMALRDLENERACGSDPLDVTPFCEACSALLNKLFAAPVAGDFFRTRTDQELERYSANVSLIMEWAVKTQTVVENIRDERAGFPDAFEIAL